MKKRAAALLMVMGFMLATAAPTAFAQGEGGCDPNPGSSEGSSAPIGTPTQGKPGHGIRDTTATEHDQHTRATGFGERVEECA